MVEKALHGVAALTDEECAAGLGLQGAGSLLDGVQARDAHEGDIGKIKNDFRWLPDRSLLEAVAQLMLGGDVDVTGGADGDSVVVVVEVDGEEVSHAGLVPPLQWPLLAVHLIRLQPSTGDSEAVASSSNQTFFPPP